MLDGFSSQLKSGLPNPAPTQSVKLTIDEQLEGRLRRRQVPVVVFAMSKGGAGKSTFTYNAAVGYQQKGQRVLIIDTDVKQQTVSKWLVRRRNDETLERSSILVETWPANEVVKRLHSREDNFDVVLVDMAGRDDPAAGSIFALATLVVSPTKPSDQDLLELHTFRRLAAAKNVKFLAVFNETSPQSLKEREQLKQDFAENGPFFEANMQHSVMARRTFRKGKGLLELSDKSVARARFQTVFDELDSNVLSVLLEKRS